jgi:dTDP-glucose 4,6-dehydratase
MTNSEGRCLLVTGGAGFIGSEYVRQVLGRRDGTVITILDKLTYAGNRSNLQAVESDPEQAARLQFVVGDIADARVVSDVIAGADAVVNFAAETHVDRSILDAEAFFRTNVLGIQVLLDAVRAESLRSDRLRSAPVRFLHVSTDEVYGSVANGRSSESAPLAPRSPYAATKAGAEHLALSYHTTFSTDVVITRGSNTYGPYQHPEKLIPLFVTNALQDQPLPLYGDGLQVRDWLHVADHARAIDYVLANGIAGNVYNVAAGQERTNREVVRLLLDGVGKPWSLVRTVEDRPGHDRRYAMDGAKLRSLGWSPTISFEEGIRETAAWYSKNHDWWTRVRSDDWDRYYEQQYGRRLATSSQA